MNKFKLSYSFINCCSSNLPSKFLSNQNSVSVNLFIVKSKENKDPPSLKVILILVLFSKNNHSKSCSGSSTFVNLPVELVKKIKREVFSFSSSAFSFPSI